MFGVPDRPTLERHPRDDVEHADARVRPDMTPKVETSDGRSGQRAHSALCLVVASNQGEHAPVVVTVAVYVQKTVAGEAADSGDGLLVAALADVDHALEGTRVLHGGLRGTTHDR